MSKHYRMSRWMLALVALFMVATTVAAWNNVQAAPAHTPFITNLPAANSEAIGHNTNSKPQPATDQTRPSVPAVSGINYSIVTSSGVITSGVYNIGNSCDDCTTAVTSTFPITYYGTAYTSFHASSNGNIQFNSAVSSLHDQGDICAPTGSENGFSAMSGVLEVYWDDLRTDQGGGTGIFTVTLGVAPHRQFIVEWRATYFGRLGTNDEEAIFYEDSPNITVIYGPNVDSGDNEGAAIQEGNGLSGNSYSLYSCDQRRLTNGLRLDYVPYNAQTTTPTPVSSATATPVSACGDLGGWAYTQPLTDQTQAPAVASDGNYVYSAGGVYTGTIYLNKLARYDPTAGNWTYLASVPISVAYASAVYAPINNKLYLFGGHILNGSTNSTNIYDIASNSWSSGAPMPRAQDSMAAGYYNGSVYLAGGGGAGIYSQTWAYNVAANTWTTRTSAPDALYGTASGVINGHLYMVGGYDTNSNYLNTTYDYDIAADSWSQRANLPTEMYYAAGAVLNGKFYNIGGGGQNELAHLGAKHSPHPASPLTSNATFIYDPTTNNWSVGTSLNQPRSYPGAASVGNAIVAVGGYVFSYNGSNSLNSVEVASIRACTATPTSTNTPTNTPTNTATNTPTNTATNTPTNTVTNTPTNTATNTPTNTSTPLPTQTVGGATATPQPTNTSTPLPTQTPAGATATPQPTNIPTSTPSGATNTATPMSSMTPTDCANVFTDITGNIFYTAIHYLNCRGVVGGLDPSHYGPAGTSTRGQFAKVVVLGFGTPLFTPTNQDFVDVPPSYFAYVYIESGFHAGILSGYDPTTCTAHGLGTPCYLPNLPITRGQLTKLVVNAGGYTLLTPIGGQQDFVDVSPGNVFYVSIETAYHNGIIAGYPDHTFQPNANIRRDQMAQIVYEGILHRP